MIIKMKFYRNIVIYKLVFAGHVMRSSSGKLILTLYWKVKSMGKKEEEDQEGSG